MSALRAQVAGEESREAVRLSTVRFPELGQAAQIQMERRKTS